jgi:multidrug efflux pump subunit AcrB
LKIEVQVDQARARRAGITSAEAANSLAAYFSGAAVTEYREGDTVIPVVIRGLEVDRSNVANLQNISVYSSARKTNVPLSQIADFKADWEFSRIKRRSQERTIAISAKHQFFKAGQIFDALQPAMKTLNLPPGYHWEMGGELENAAKAQRYLFANMPICFALIIFLLVWQFNSFRRPLIILLTIPLTFIGAVVGLIVMKAVFGFMVILGLLSLAGIIINNGIVLIDRIDIERASGLDAYDAVVAAALARFRPILITTITTVLGLLTLIISKDPLFYGMANVIAFGLALGTVFTLGVVPIFYTLLFGVKIPPKTKVAPKTA